MEYYEFIEIIVGNMLEFADTGRMAREGVEFFDTPYEMVAIYNTNGVPYIVFQEEGTQYYDKNKGFISVKAEGKLAKKIWSENLGLPYDMNENTDTILENQLKMVQDLGGYVNV